MGKKVGMESAPGMAMQALVAIFFIVAGIIGVQGYNSTVSGIARFFGRNDALAIVVAVVEIAVGAILALGFVVKIPKGIGGILALIFPILWAIWVILQWFGRDAFKPDFATWLFGFSRDLVILVALWIASLRLGASD